MRQRLLLCIQRVDSPREWFEVMLETASVAVGSQLRRLQRWVLSSLLSSALADCELTGPEVTPHLPSQF